MYKRVEVQDHVTIMNKALYDNLQDGIDESKEEIGNLQENAQKDKEEFNNHKNLTVVSESGSHGLRYKDEALQVKDKENGEWSNIVMPTTDLTKEDVDEIMDDLEINYDSENGGIDGVTKLQQAIDIVNDDLQDTKEDTQDAINEIVNTIGYINKNFIPYPHSETTQTDNGVTWTDNGDGTVTGNGTSTGSSSYTLRPRKNNPLLLKKGKYILSGCASGGSATTYSLVVLKTNADDTGYDIVANDFGESAEFELTEDTEVGVMIVAWASGVELPNLTFKPMISKDLREYVPYVPDVQTHIGNHQSLLNTINNRLYWENGAVVLKSVNALELQDGKGRGVWLTYNDSWGTNVSYIIPTVNKSVNLGKTDYHFKSVYCESVTQSSDRRMKNNINYSVADMVELVNNLKPCSFKYNDSDDMQYGLIAQDVRDYLVENNKDFNGLVIDKLDNCTDENVDKFTDENSVVYGLDYTKIIPCLIAKIQELEERVSNLEQS